jgi:type IV secretory pathway VirB10-like protein
VADRKRREYESLFASNVVLSRRPEADRPDAGVGSGGPSIGDQRVSSDLPSLQEVADAVVRATGRQNVGPTPSATSGSESQASADSRQANAAKAEERTPERTEAISAAGPLHPLLEGTVIDAVLTNRLDGSGTAPVNCLVTNPVYSHSGQYILIPAGARILGETRPVHCHSDDQGEMAGALQAPKDLVVYGDRRPI